MCSLKLSKGPAWRQGGWAIMAQIDERFEATTKSRVDIGSGRDSESP